MERLKNWGSQKKEILIFWMQEIPLLGASQKLEFKKKGTQTFWMQEIPVLGASQN